METFRICITKPPNCDLKFEKQTTKNVFIVSADNCNANISNWKCNPCYFNASDGCDCDCGAYDPDCDDDSDSPYNCDKGIGPSCDQAGNCQYLNPIPTNWTCDPSNYNASDGCDCNCGAYDPDCDNDKFTVYGCEFINDSICLPNGTCTTRYIPPLWACLSEYYNTNDGCDCNCGAHDPDCDNDTLVLNCPCKSMECNNGICTGLCNGYITTLKATDGWTIAFGTLLSLNLVLVFIYLVFYRKRLLRRVENKDYALLDK